MAAARLRDHAADGLLRVADWATRAAGRLRSGGPPVTEVDPEPAGDVPAHWRDLVGNGRFIGTPGSLSQRGFGSTVPARTAEQDVAPSVHPGQRALASAGAGSTPPGSPAGSDLRPSIVDITGRRPRTPVVPATAGPPPDVAWPPVARPDATRPDAARWNVAQQDIGRQDIGRQDIARHGVGRRGFGQQGTAQPGGATRGGAETGMARPGVPQPATAAPAPTRPAVAPATVAPPAAPPPAVTSPAVTSPAVTVRRRPAVRVEVRAAGAAAPDAPRPSFTGGRIAVGQAPSRGDEGSRVPNRRPEPVAADPRPQPPVATWPSPAAPVPAVAPRFPEATPPTPTSPFAGRPAPDGAAVTPGVHRPTWPPLPRYEPGWLPDAPPVTADPDRAERLRAEQEGRPWNG